MLVKKENITQYIPQSHPIVMVDELISCEGSGTVTRFTVRPENIFVKNNYLQEPGLIENMAQSAAARAGYETRQLGKKPQLGFIGAIKDLEIYDFPACGSVIETSITITNMVMDVTIIKGIVHCAGKKMAECEMKIFIQPEKNA
jgi:predicted hotdog family 3-hydroxylacyl-ACP dehydratase